jgi:mannose-6-phosphate isomerase
MLWGGRRLPEFVRHPFDSEHPLGEAWVLSDVDGNHSVIANGPHAGRTLRELIAANPVGVFGERVPSDGRFPLLLKFLDTQRELSVQVHPNDEQARRLKGPNHRGKTEAWVILDACPDSSLIYAGFRHGTTAESFREAMAADRSADALHSFPPKAGDCVFLEAGTVHAIGANILLFEVQQTSDITYRLFDWNRVDEKTGQPRELHIDDGLHCSNFALGPREPSELPLRCDYFEMHRHEDEAPRMLGQAGECRAVVCVKGQGSIAGEAVEAGDVILLPAAVGTVPANPEGTWTLLEIGLGNL